MFAYCGPDGVIQFGEQLPQGKLPISKCPPEKSVLDWRAGIEVMARRSYDRGVFLVPGIPECRKETGEIDQDKAYVAFLAFRARVAAGFVSIEAK